MKKETREYVLGERNAVKDEFILSRETIGNVEHVYVSLPEDENPIHDFWTKRGRRIKAKPGDINTEVVSAPGPKHTGGKRPYIMLMQDRPVSELSFDARAFLFTIFCENFIEWHTGKVVDRRSKKPLTTKKMAKTFGIGIVRLKKVVSELESKGIISYNSRQSCYIVSQDFAKKGVPK